MLLTDRIPEYIFNSLLSEGVAREDIMMATYCDKNSEHVFCDTYIFATLKKMYVLSGTVCAVLDENSKRGKSENVWREESFSEYDIDEIERIKIEDLISGARLTLKMKSGEYVFATAMTNTCRNSVLLFVKYFERMKKGDITSPNFEIDSEDDPKGRVCPKCGMRYPDKNRKICPRCMEKGKLYKRFAAFLMKYKKYIFIMLMSLVLLTATSILVPYISNEFFFDEVLSEDGDFFGQILLVIGLVIATRLLAQVFSIINGFISAKIAAKVVYDLKMTVFTSIEKLSMTFFGGRQTGGLMTQVNNDSNTIYKKIRNSIAKKRINGI